LIGERKPRQRVLTDTELKAFWHATEAMGYPFGLLFQLLLLTGCRKMEIGGARWSEVDEDKALLTVPPERFKSEAQHLVPLSGSALAILKTLPHFEKGDFLFSSTFGDRPVTGFAGAKERLDALMGSELKPWRIHDLRRTVRTRLAGLRIADVVAEMVIGHGKRGLGRVYDQHRYIDEMREALELWANKLRDITEPPPENLVKLNKKRA
jgi:integrase